MKFNIEEVIKKETKKEIIDEIFNQVYDVRRDVLRDNPAELSDAKKTLEAQLIFSEEYISKYCIQMSRESVTGFYIKLPRNLPQSVMSKMNPLFRMFFTCEGEGKKIMLGDENSRDVENTLQNARLFICECLHKLIDGDFNSKLENDLKINNLNDFRIILLDEMLSKKLANYIITYTVFKFRNLAKSNSNPDFECYWDKYEKKYIFKKIVKENLDKRKDDSNEDGYSFTEGLYDDLDNTFAELSTEKDKESTHNTFISYMVDNYINKGQLTNKQYGYWNDCLQYEYNKDGLKKIYSKQQINQFNKQILKRLESKLELDDNVAFVKGIQTCRFVKTKLMDEYGTKIEKKITVQNEGRYILLDNYSTIKMGMGDTNNAKIA